MDGSPYRDSRASERRVINNSQQPEQPGRIQYAKDAPQRPAQGSQSRPPRRKRSLKGVLIPLVIILVVALVAVGGWFAWSKMQNSNTGIDTSKYQAVFFTNGQVYFGKLEAFNDGYLKLTDIYYLQTDSADSADGLQQTSTDQNNVQLIKLGEEIHGPEDEMIISKDQVLFYENLKTNGRVAQSIAQYQSNN